MKARGMEYRGRAEEKEREIREEGKERGDKPKCTEGGGVRRIRRQQRKLEPLNRTASSDVSAVVLFHFVYLQAVITEVCMHVGGAFQLMDGLSRYGRRVAGRRREMEEEGVVEGKME